MHDYDNQNEGVFIARKKISTNTGFGSKTSFCFMIISTAVNLIAVFWHLKANLTKII